VSFPGFGLDRWAGVLRGRIITDQQDEDSAIKAADALAEVLDAELPERLTERLIEIQKNNKKED
jgi:hypothetical protein